KCLKVITNAEEIIIPEKSVDFTDFPEPIVDIQVTGNEILSFLKFINLKEKDSVPDGFHVIRRSITGKFKANIEGRIGDEVYLCYRRGRDKPPITNISMFVDNGDRSLRPGATKISKTLDGKNANLRYGLMHPAYISYSRASASSGIDQLAVIDMCIIIPSKQETCPPAFNKIPESLTSNPLVPYVYLCFRKSLIKQHTIAYEPEILFRYHVPPMSMEFDYAVNNQTERDSLAQDQHQSLADPLTHESDEPIDPEICQVANFCLPWGASLESWSVEQDCPQPNHFTFVLTNETSQRLYGVAFTFHEPYDVKNLDKDQCYRLGVDPEPLFPSRTATDTSTSPLHSTDELDPEEEARITARQKHFLRSRVGDRVVGVTKTMCLLSRWSFPVAFANFLAFLYSRCYPAANSDPIPLERYLAYFLCEVPFPDQNTPNILVELCAAPILLQLPIETNASSSCEPFFYLLSQLGVDLTINLFVHMLTEQKILLTSVHHFLLTQIGEALTSMIFPLQWAVVYIPFIYMGHVQVIQSPSPYLIGVDSRFFDFFRMPPGGGGVTYVDLDTKNFIPANCPGQMVLDAKLLPATDIGVRVKEAFMQFMARLLKNYRAYLIPVRDAERDQLFNSKAFLEAAADKKSRPFYQTLFETQQWANFVRDRSYASIRDEELAYFDHLIFKLFGPCSTYGSSRAASELSVTSGGGSSSHRSSKDQDIHELVSGPCDSMVGLRTARDEPTMLRLLSRESTRIIGPPAWPLPAAIFGHSIADPDLSTKRRVSDCKRTVAPRPFDLVPIRWNVRLLNRLAVYAYRLQALSMDDTFRLELAGSHIDEQHTRSDLLSDTTGLPILANGWQSMAPYRLARGPSVLPDHILSAVVDNPSPLPPRAASNTVLGLTGLPTKFPIPVGSNVIFRRSPLEIRQTVERYRETIQDGGIIWAKQLVAAIYSLWFMMLPAHLAALYAHVIDEPRSDPGELLTEQHRGNDPEPNITVAADVINVCLSDAVRVATRLAEHRIECPDQVILRILLVLIYQHRPPDIPVDVYMDSVFWNDASLGLANHISKPFTYHLHFDFQIFKACEKERQEKERERARAHPGRPVTNCAHRRSASVSHATGELNAVYSEPSFVAYQQENPGHDAYTVSPDRPHKGDGGSVIDSSDPIMTHKRSSSSTAATSFVFPSTGSIRPAKSDADSGLLVNLTGAGEEFVGSTEEARGRESHTPDTPGDDVLAVGATGLEHSVRSLQVTESPADSDPDIIVASRAPLASVDDLTDLGYSTLQRPPSRADQVDVDPSTLIDPANTLLSDHLAGSQLPVVKPLPNSSFAPSDVNVTTLEPVQKAPSSTWLEQPSTEFRPARDGKLSTAVSNSSTNVHLIDRQTNTTDADSFSGSRTSDESAGINCVPLTESVPPVSGTHLNQPSLVSQCEPPPHIGGIIPDPDSSESFPKSSHEQMNHFSEKPRRSLDYLNDALSSIGKSDITSKMIKSVRDWFTPKQHNHPSTAESTPLAGGRRATAVGLSTPNSARLPRNMRRWQLRSDATPQPASVQDPSIAEWVEESDTYLQGAEEEFGNLGPAAVRVQALNDLHYCRDLWFHIGGNLVIGTLYQRLYPATLSSYLSKASVRCSPGSHVSPVHLSSPDALPKRLREGRASKSPFSRHEGTHSPQDARKPCANQSLNDCSLHLGADGVGCEDARITHLNIFLTTCTACPGCSKYVHDEEIMAAWSMDEDEYNIHCPFCDQLFVPQLTIRVVGEVDSSPVKSPADSTTSPSIPPRVPDINRSHHRGSASGSLGNCQKIPQNVNNSVYRCRFPCSFISSLFSENLSLHVSCDLGALLTSGASSGRTVKALMEFTQFYLSPFVLRKSLETVLQREGDESFRLHSPKHGLLYRHERLAWNLVWYIHRLGLPTHLLDAFPAWLMEHQMGRLRPSRPSETPGEARRSTSSNRPVNSLLSVSFSSFA
ncbi:DENN domain-containing protein 4, partial [Paragonimus westermani]